MESLTKLLNWINDNFAAIVTVVILIIAIYEKVVYSIKKWNEKTKEEKEAIEKEILDKAIEKAKESLKEFILSLVAQAEINWSDPKTGQIKRAEVIEKIYQKYPILNDIENKEELIAYIDELINQSLIIVREKIRPTDKPAEEEKEEEYNVIKVNE